MVVRGINKYKHAHFVTNKVIISELVQWPWKTIIVLESSLDNLNNPPVCVRWHLRDCELLLIPPHRTSYCESVPSLYYSYYLYIIIVTNDEVAKGACKWTNFQAPTQQFFIWAWGKSGNEAKRKQNLGLCFVHRLQVDIQTVCTPKGKNITLALHYFLCLSFILSFRQGNILH